MANQFQEAALKRIAERRAEQEAAREREQREKEEKHEREQAALAVWLDWFERQYGFRPGDPLEIQILEQNQTDNLFTVYLWTLHQVGCVQSAGYWIIQAGTVVRGVCATTELLEWRGQYKSAYAEFLNPMDAILYALNLDEMNTDSFIAEQLELATPAAGEVELPF